jgi:transposase
MYSEVGRPSIPPEKLLRAQLLQMLYSIRSERLLMEEIDYNMLFRWFIGLNLDDDVWDPTVFTKNRDRLLEADVAKEFLAEVVGQAQRQGWTSDEHFSVDGTLLEAWASANGNADYPVLQVIYPDLQNRFQWEEGFENRFIQPLLQLGTPCTHVDHQFWDSIKKDDERFPGWKFPDKPHTKVFISKAIQEDKECITYVTHDLSDGAWQILGETGVESGGPELACLHHLVEKDPTLAELADLQKGWYAERTAPGEPWERFESGPEETDE